MRRGTISRREKEQKKSRLGSTERVSFTIKNAREDLHVSSLIREAYILMSWRSHSCGSQLRMMLIVLLIMESSKTAHIEVRREKFDSLRGKVEIWHQGELGASGVDSVAKWIYAWFA